MSSSLDLGADNQEIFVELPINFLAVAEGELDFVFALLVAYLGVGHRVLAGLVQR